MKSEFKIGQMIELVHDVEIKAVVSGQVLVAKKGDCAVVDSKGFATFVDGDARGKITRLSDVVVKGYDHENITDMIIKKLNYLFNDLDDTLECEGLNCDVLKEEIQDVLENIL